LPASKHQSLLGVEAALSLLYHFFTTSMTIGICGGGTMGAGIALLCLQAEHTVIIYDPQTQVQERCMGFLRKELEKLVTRGIVAQTFVSDAVARCSFTTALQDVQGCAVVIEAVIEDRAVKTALYRALENVVSDDAIIATNTSSISITALAASMRLPERFVGMHFFNPAHIMKLVEVVSGAKTAPEAAERVIQLANGLGKTPVAVRDVPGFIVNRVARNYYLESMRLVEEGAAEIAQVDALMQSAGFKLGPFALMDLIGIDVNYAVTLSVWEQYFREPRFAPVLMQKTYVEAGLHGRKMGRGFYDYEEEKSSA
jgi:3-hydroxybutyryl-CoA dehydrogenase